MGVSFVIEKESPEIIFSWGTDASQEKFLDVTESPMGLSVTIHPGLSDIQIREAASELGSHGPAIIAAWERKVGFTA